MNTKDDSWGKVGMLPNGFRESFSDVLEQLADLVDRLEDPQSGMTMEIEQVTINLPIELNVASEEDAIVLSGSAPTQTVETTIFPVLHRMTLTIVATNGQ